MDEIEKLRQQFAITKTKTFLNHASVSPIPKPVADAIRGYADETSTSVIASFQHEDFGKPFFARLIGAEPAEIATVGNTSTGLNIAANAVRCPRGSKVVTTDLEYASVVYPFLRKNAGVKVHYVKNRDGRILLDDMEKAVDDKTAAVVISHVEYAIGFRNNLRVISEIAHEHGACLIVDAIQSAGTMPIDVKRDDVDFLTAGCYKWLLSMHGAGYLYVKDELIEKLEPPFVGWASVEPSVFETDDVWDIRSMPLSKTACRFEVGSPALVCYRAAAEAMKMLLGVGLAKIEGRIMKLTGRLINALENAGLKLQTPLEKDCRSGIVNFKFRKPQTLVDKLDKRGIVVSARSNGVRVSPHFYNTEEEVDRLMKAVRSVA